MSARAPGALVLLSGKIAATASQGLILIVLARIEGPAAVGLYTLALAIVSPVYLLAHLRMQDVLSTHRESYEVWSSHLRVVLVGSVLALLAATGISLLWPTPGLWLIVLPLSIAKTAESVAFTCHGFWQSESRLELVAGSNLIRALTSLAAVVTGTILGGLAVGVWSLAAVWVVGLLAFELPRTPRFAASRKGSDRTLSMLYRLIPLGVVAMLLSLNQNVVRLIVEFHVGAAQLGVFAATAYLVRTGAIAAQAIGQSRSADLRAARLTDDADLIYRIGVSSGARAMLVGFVLLVVGVAIGPALVAALYGPSFRPSLSLAASTFAAGVPLFGSTALAVAAVAVGRHTRYVAVVMTSLVVTAALAVALTPTLGLVGASLAWAVGECVKTGLLIVHLRRSTRTSVSSPS